MVDDTKNQTAMVPAPDAALLLSAMCNAAELNPTTMETLPRRLLDVAGRIRTNETLHRDDDVVDQAAHALRAALIAGASAAARPPEPMARFCPACGSVGEVPDTYRDCCPDGIKARVIPAALAQQCHDLFALALDNVLRPDQPEPNVGTASWSDAEAVALANRSGFAGTCWTMGPEELSHMLNLAGSATAPQPAAPFLFVQMDDDRAAHLTWCADSDAVREAVKGAMFFSHDGAELDAEHAEQLAGSVDELMDSGALTFEGDPPLYLYRVSGVAPAARPAGHVPAGRAMESLVDAALGLVTLPPIRVSERAHTLLQRIADAEGVVLQAVVRKALEPGPVMGGERQAHPAPYAEPVAWPDCERICDLPAVDAAIRALLDDNTGGNATEVVRAVLEAAGPVARPAGPVPASAIQALEQIHMLAGAEAWEYRQIALTALAQIEREAANPKQLAALLVRDLAADVGAEPLLVCRLLDALGFGQHSVNMAVTARMAREVTKHFSVGRTQQPAPQPLSEARAKAGAILSAIQALNSSPYNLTKGECITVLSELRDSLLGIGAGPKAPATDKGQQR